MTSKNEKITVIVRADGEVWYKDGPETMQTFIEREECLKGDLDILTICQDSSEVDHGNVNQIRGIMKQRYPNSNPRIVQVRLNGGKYVVV